MTQVRLIKATAIGAISLCALLGASMALAGASASSGSLTQLAGTNGCFSESGESGCAVSRSTDKAEGIVISHDGKNAYLASETDDAVVIFSRDPATGALSQLSGTAGCINEGGTEGCATGRGLDGAHGVAISPDDVTVYVASEGSDAIAVFHRDPATGKLKQLKGKKGCIAEGGVEGCATGRGLNIVLALVVDPNGHFVYSAALSPGSVAAFSRDPSTGQLKQLAGTNGCIAESAGDGCAIGRGIAAARGIAIDHHGTSLYVASFGLQRRVDGGVAIFQIDHHGVLSQPSGTDGCKNEANVDGCGTGRALSGAGRVTVSSDGANVYVGAHYGGNGNGAVAVFSRDALHGFLTQLSGSKGCVTEDPGGEGCSIVLEVEGQPAVAVSPDGKNLYVASDISDGVAIFARNVSSGALNQLNGTDGCIDWVGSVPDELGCATAKGLDGASWIALDPNGNNVYVTAEDSTTAGGAVFSRN